MTNIDNQVDYWNKVAWDKEFTHTLNLAWLGKHLSRDSRILDYGCGYGRLCQELARAGYRNVVGLDSSAEMIQRGRQQYPGLPLEVLPPAGLDDPAGSVDAVLLVAVLTCLPTDAGQQALLKTLESVLRPGGLLYISDYLLQPDERNQQRYRQYADEFGTYGVFRLPEGAVVRHHTRHWVDILTAAFERLELVELDVVSMNGNPAKGFQYLGRKRS